ncbi:MAG: GNAT family N-acetyltransferase [Lentilitoribacter sp.]
MKRRMDIRAATPSEFEIVTKWAADEGWNPGLNDLEAFYAADPEGFLIGLIDGEIACSISVVKYGNDYGFLGFYIVHPNHRGKGFGLQIWNAGMARLAGRTIGLDGVVEQQDNYRKSGFKYAYDNIRYQGVVSKPKLTLLKTAHLGLEIRPVIEDDFNQILAFDKTCFGAERESFLRSWLNNEQLELRCSLVASSESLIMGFGAVRKCIDGYKIGPLFAQDLPTAKQLLGLLIDKLPSSASITFDVPEPNVQAVMLAEELELDPVFSTARMYRGNAINVKIEQVFGITTFELG